jgi:hypothetical protein
MAYATVPRYSLLQYVDDVLSRPGLAAVVTRIEDKRYTVVMVPRALIAAAPEMYKALEECLERLGAYKSTGMSFPITERRARAALAKARGEEVAK